MVILQTFLNDNCLGNTIADPLGVRIDRVSLQLVNLTKLSVKTWFLH